MQAKIEMPLPKINVTDDSFLPENMRTPPVYYCDDDEWKQQKPSDEEEDEDSSEPEKEDVHAPYIPANMEVE